MRKIPYPHPGEILLEEFLKPMGITQYRLAKEIGVPQRRIGEIVAGKRAVTADTGLRLSRFFGISDGFWVGLQTDFDAAVADEAYDRSLDGPGTHVGIDLRNVVQCAGGKDVNQRDRAGSDGASRGARQGTIIACNSRPGGRPGAVCGRRG